MSSIASELVDTRIVEFAVAEQLFELVLVFVRFADGFFEDRRIGGHPLEPVLLDQSR